MQINQEEEDVQMKGGKASKEGIALRMRSIRYTSLNKVR
jgi:hypothetical protein